jgi:hypothetical protein
MNLSSIEENKGNYGSSYRLAFKYYAPARRQRCIHIITRDEREVYFQPGFTSCRTSDGEGSLDAYMAFSHDDNPQLTQGSMGWKLNSQVVNCRSFLFLVPGFLDYGSTNSVLISRL